jgi:hypothetical protein
MSNAPVFYTTIRPAIGQTVAHVIKRAQALGYELVQFNGYTDADIGPSGEKRAEATTNARRADQIQNACRVDFDDGAVDFPHIRFTA